jgi:hypothetical protein
MITLQLHTEVRGGSIIVTLPGTSYVVTYCKSLREAWQLAHLRARELGFYSCLCWALTRPAIAWVREVVTTIVR